MVFDAFPNTGYFQNMKIPLPYCIVSILLAVGVTWYFRTKDMDFSPPDGYVAGSVPEQQVVEADVEPVLYGPPAPPPADLSDLPSLTQIPALDAFSDLELSLEDQQRIFAILRSEGEAEVERTYFLGERLLESPELTTEEKRDITFYLFPLQSKVGYWIFDENEERSISVSLSGVSNEGKFRSFISEQLNEIIAASSSGQVSAEVDFTEGALAVSVSIGERLLGSQLLIQSDDIQEIVSALYHVISAAVLDAEMVLPVFESASINEFEVALTRYAWQKLFNLPADESPE